MMVNCTVIRIIIGSPSDLAEERARFHEIIAVVIIKG
jgi:hypothetical protein